MTLNERVYTVAEKLAPPFVLQFIIKGTGVIEPVKMREAVAKLAEKLDSSVRHFTHCAVSQPSA